MLANFELSFADPRVYIPTRKLSAIPPMPSTPNLKPQRLSSIAEPDKSSWRLSFASPNRGEQLRRLSKEYAVPLFTISNLLEANVAPTRRWLHGQGLRSLSQGLETSASYNLEAFYPPDHTETQDLGGVDGPDDSVYKVPENQTDLSAILATDQVKPSSAPKGSRLDSDQSDNSQYIAGYRARHTHNTSNSIPLSERLPPSWGRKRDEDELSYPLTLIPTIQHSPRTSRFSLISLLSSQKGKSESKEAFGVYTFKDCSVVKTNAV